MSKSDNEPATHTPYSVFYPGRRRSRTKSFRPTHETQRRLDNQRYRQQKTGKR
jgi:hypothetical protein